MLGVSDVSTVENNAMGENFFSKYKSTGIFSHCQKTVTVSSEMFLNYFSIYDFSMVCKSPVERWSNEILSNNCPIMTQCIYCKNACRVNSTIFWL